jgi:hypothetical protein
MSKFSKPLKYQIKISRTQKITISQEALTMIIVEENRTEKKKIVMTESKNIAKRKKAVMIETKKREITKTETINKETDKGTVRKKIEKGMRSRSRNSVKKSLISQKTINQSKNKQKNLL